MPDSKYIFDTVSISNFAFADSLGLLIARYRNSAFITSEVYDEILAGISSGYEKLRPIEDSLKNKSLKIINLRADEYDTYKTHLKVLGKGEASSITVAFHRRMIFVSDDRRAREVSKEMKIKITGTLGILKASISNGQISLHQADSILKTMIDSGFYSPVNSLSHID